MATCKRREMAAPSSNTGNTVLGCAVKERNGEPKVASPCALGLDQIGPILEVRVVKRFKEAEASNQRFGLWKLNPEPPGWGSVV